MKAVKGLFLAASLLAVSGGVMADGESVYNSGCAACHASGVAGAPKLGDAAAWTERLKQDKETIYKHAIEGFQGATGVMPPKGGFMNLSDDEIKQAVDYMIEASS